MIGFFKNKKNNEVNDDNSYSKIAALLIHAAKIDEAYDEKERNIIKKTLIELGAESMNIDKLISEATIIEKNSNQILEFTKEIKNTDEKFKIKVVEILYNIIYSDGTSDMYESNFMRRITGLLYLDKKVVGNIKEKIKNKLNK